MSNSVTLSDVATLVKTGNIADAKRHTAALLASAEPQDLEIIAQCAYILETWPKIGVLKLRDYWNRANAHDRAIIAACAPERGEQRHRPEQATTREPRWTRRNQYQAPRDVCHEVRPELRRAAHRPTPEEPAVVADYQRERAGIDDLPGRAEQPVGYAIDYDRAAVPDLRGTPCVRCWLERSTGEQTGRQDDGLCTDCRTSGRPGIPSLPDGHTRDDAIEARCAFIAHTFPKAAVKLLRRYWQQCTGDHDRKVIAAWVQRHDLTELTRTASPAVVETITAEPAACATCGESRRVCDVRHLATDDGLCTDCRALDCCSVQQSEPAADESGESDNAEQVTAPAA
jgi:hypothetical protein